MVIFTFKDYGITYDEQMQRNHLLKNYNEYVKIINKVIKMDSIKSHHDYISLGLSVHNINMVIKKKIGKVNIYLLFTNSVLVFTLLFCIIGRPKLYGGWRHLYLLYPLIIINSIVGLKYLFDKFKSSKLR